MIIGSSQLTRTMKPAYNGAAGGQIFFTLLAGAA